MLDYVKKLNDDRMDKELDQFIAGLPRSKRASNVYDIRCYDKDGNITDHKFGVNVLTNYGFQRLYTTRDESTYVLFGTGSGTPSKTDQQLWEAIPNQRTHSQNCYYEEGDGHVNGWITGNRTSYFDAASNSIISRKKSSQITLDYNYDWITQDWDITEFGEYTETKYVNPNYYPADDYHLQTHCLVYDDQHQPSYFTKRMNEKVIITVYRSNSFCFDIVDALWNQGIYLFMNPLYFYRLAGQNYYASGAGWSNYWRSSYLIKTLCILNGRCIEEDTFPMYYASNTFLGGSQSSTNSGTYHWISRSFNRGFGHNDQVGYYRFRTNYEDNNQSSVGMQSMCYQTSHTDGYRNDIFIKEKVMTNTKHIYGLGICRSFDVTYGKQRDIEFFIEKFNLETPEEMTNDFIYTDDWWHPRFSTCFGVRGWFENVKLFENTFPVNDFHITSVKRYNYKTDAYDIVETFTDDPTYDFRNPERAIQGTMTLTSGSLFSGSYDVGVNINTDVAVVGFNEPATFDIYLTDKYWDQSTFVKLDDNKVVPAALQHKKYFIRYPATWDENAQMGFHAIREKNNHTLVPSVAPYVMDTDPVTLIEPRSDYRWHHHYYASDEGWIYCDNTLIYPDSDDGTGHPYRYTLSGYASDRYGSDLYFSKNHIAVGATEYHYVQMNNTTDVLLTIYNPDPAHPDVDPNTTKVEYFGADLHFNENTGNTELYTYMQFHVERKKDLLFISRGGKIRMIDMNSPTKNSDFLPETFHWHWHFVFDTNYLVCYRSTSAEAYNFMVYDYVNKQIAHEFSIPIEGTGWNYNGCFGYDHTIYVNINRDGSYHLYMYDMNTEGLVVIADKPLNYIIQQDSGTYGYRNINDKTNNYDYDDETLVIHCATYRYGSDGNYGYRTFWIYKETQDQIVYTDRSNSPYQFILDSQIGYPCLRKFNDGKDYVLLLTCNMNVNVSDSSTISSYVSTFIINLGYIKNKGYNSPQQLHDNIYVMPYHGPTECANFYGESATTTIPSPYRFNSNNAWFGHMVFYKNTTITFNTFGPPIVSPIEMCLPHQVTGTTKSINCYNSPKKMNELHRGVVVNNLES